MAPLASPCHPATGRGKGGAPKGEIADLFRLYGPPYCAAHPVPPPHHTVRHDLMVCRTAELGGVLVK